MSECKWCKDEFCVNADCPMRADYCPVPDNEGVCRYEERIDDKEVKMKTCREYKNNKAQLSSTISELEENAPCSFRFEYSDKDAASYGTCIFFDSKLCRLAEGEGKDNGKKIQEVNFSVKKCDECYHFPVCKHAEQWKDIEQTKSKECKNSLNLRTFEKMEKTYITSVAISKALFEIAEDSKDSTKTQNDTIVHESDENVSTGFIFL